MHKPFCRNYCIRKLRCFAFGQRNDIISKPLRGFYADSGELVEVADKFIKAFHFEL